MVMLVIATQKPCKCCATPEAHTYSKHCPECMARKITRLRTRDGKTSKRLQLGLFEWMGEDMAREVKKLLTPR